MRFLIDENLSERFVRGMDAFGEHVVHGKDEPGEGTPDEELLEHVGSAGLTLVTRDLRMLYRPAEKDAFLRHKVGAFFLHGGELSMCAIIRALVHHWPKMKALAKDTDRPFAFKVYASGGVVERPL